MKLILTNHAVSYPLNFKSALGEERDAAASRLIQILDRWLMFMPDSAEADYLTLLYHRAIDETRRYPHRTAFRSARLRTIAEPEHYGKAGG